MTIAMTKIKIIATFFLFINPNVLKIYICYVKKDQCKKKKNSPGESALINLFIVFGFNLN